MSSLLVDYSSEATTDVIDYLFLTHQRYLLVVLYLQDISRARTRFFHKRVNILLTTGRFFFFRRYRLRGVKSIIFYGLPAHEYFYSQMMNVMVSNESSAPASVALFSKYDAMQLERIVGSDRFKRMIRGEKSTYMFC